MSTYTLTDINYDYAIGGLPFLSAAGQRLSAYSSATLDRQTAPYRKDQTDQSTEVGEQSLSFWWTRSQSSFHGGAGQAFVDGGDLDVFRKIRFAESRGLDVWTEGAVSLLPAMTAGNTDTGTAYQVVPSASSNGGVYTTAGHGGVSGLWYVNSTGTWAQVTGYTGTVASDFTSDGIYIYFATSTGVWKVTSGGTAASQMYATTIVPNLRYAKQRLLALKVNSIYELDVTASGTTALPAVLYSHPNAFMSFTAAVEGPTGIYVAGDANGVSTLFLMGLVTTSGVPTLGPPVSVLPFLQGERFWGTAFCIVSYLNKFLAVATNKGVRIAKIATDGSLDLGPLTLEKDPAAGAFWFGGFATYDRFVYAVCKGVSPAELGGFQESGAYRIDLSLEIATGRYAWAKDQSTADTSHSPVSCCIDQAGMLWIAGDSSPSMNLWKTSATAYVTDAYLLTSRIRFSTGDDKVFERLQVSAEGTAGSVSGIPYLNGDLAASYTTVTLTAGAGTERNEARIPDSFTGKKTTHIQVKLVFTPADTFATAKLMLLRGYVLKALPAQKRQRVERIPLMCFDLEQDQNRQPRGALGTAFGRLRALEALEEAGGVLTLQRFGPSFTSADDQSVVIDDIEFVQIGAPNKTNGWGGVILLTVRTVD